MTAAQSRGGENALWLCLGQETLKQCSNKSTSLAGHSMAVTCFLPTQLFGLDVFFTKGKTSGRENECPLRIETGLTRLGF